ncbi:MAG: hypothetical protein ABIJ09_26585, partial [Pseudomonadota bacterium]
MTGPHRDPTAKRRTLAWGTVLSAVLSALIACPPPTPPPDEGGMDSRIIADARGIVPPLLCPGARGCEHATGALRVGVAARTITPKVETWQDLDGNGVHNGDEPFDDLDHDGVWDPVWIAGYGPGRAATGVHDDTWVRVLTFSRGALRVALVSVDIVGLFHDDVVRLRQAAVDAGLDLDHILVTSTHVHEGKDTMGYWGEVFGRSGYDPDYMQWMQERSIEALAEAITGERETRIRAIRTPAPPFARDSRRPQVMDPDLLVVAFEDAQQQTFASLVSWANHPETLDNENTLLTSDFAHYLRDEMEAGLPGSLSIYMQGAVGGQMVPFGFVACPGAQDEETCPQGTFERAEKIGREAARSALAGLQSSAVVVDTDPVLALRRQPFFASTQNSVFVALFQWGVFPRRIYDSKGEPYEQEYIEYLTLEDALAGELLVHTETNALSLGPLELITAPGELYNELWLQPEGGGSFIEHPEGADFPDAPAETPLSSYVPPGKIGVLVGLGNDELGYIIPKAQYDAVLPGAYNPDGQYGEYNSFGYEMAPTVAGAVEAMY